MARRLLFIPAFLLFAPYLLVFCVTGLIAGAGTWIITGKDGFDAMDRIVSFGCIPIDIIAEWVNI